MRVLNKLRQRPTGPSISSTCIRSHSRDAKMQGVPERRQAGQAEQLRAELWRHVEELSRSLEHAERRERRVSDWSCRQSRQMRTELYQAHHMIDALNRRFPATSDEGQL